MPLDFLDANFAYIIVVAVAAGVGLAFLLLLKEDEYLENNH